MTRLALLAAAVAGAAVLTACGGESASDSDSSASSTVSTRVSTSAPAGSTDQAHPEQPTAAPEPPVAVPAEPPVAAPEPPAEEPPAAPPETSASAPVTDHCADVTREYLITTLRMTGGPQFPLADLEQPRCSGEYATAMSVPDGETPPSMYLFQYGEQGGHTHWRVIDAGSALDCVNSHGVPAEVARRIQCGA
ncbi:hypothetical protein GV792_12930 [Nocardia cyriacigeorgica]|uniref:hypothetical protein n=1 Tax=Nocardia cyriacigeorgica TaxID=135487 RepID=UPI0013BA5FAE|nr:hypothetical protein [Nocardia cyriacigeorgica]NEW50964.1 hypothetical protein [Nocardia cyriacigeorgica]